MSNDGLIREPRRPEAGGGGERLLFLTDDQLRLGVELMFFAYRAFTRDPDDILAEAGLGRAHHRALHFIAAREAATVSDLIEILGVTKQSLNRVLRDLRRRGLATQRIGDADRRQRLLSLTEEGRAFERRLAEAQRSRMRRAYREAGPDAVNGFRLVLERMLDDGARDELVAFMRRRQPFQRQRGPKLESKSAARSAARSADGDR